MRPSACDCDTPANWLATIPAWNDRDGRTRARNPICAPDVVTSRRLLCALRTVVQRGRTTPSNVCVMQATLLSLSFKQTLAQLTELN